MSGNQKLLNEGKTKIIWDAGNGEVLVESKDAITAGDGAKHDLLAGKAVDSTATTSHCFELLEARGVSTHYIGQVDDRTFRARNIRMIPLELVARRIATGSYLKRNPDVVEGTIFDHIVFEFFEKDDANHDPLVEFNLAEGTLTRYDASKPKSDASMARQALRYTRFANYMTNERLRQLQEITIRVFLELERAWAIENVTLVDLKIECGWDRETRKLLVADVIDNDSWRIWPAGDKAQMKDKQVYRDLADTEDPAAKAKELGKIKQNYAWVAEATSAFTAS